jgi:hypothetical protein
MGRGGAGNTLAASDLDQSEVNTNVKVLNKQGNDDKNRGHSGRGGAGNWRQGAEEERLMAEEREREERKTVDEKVKRDVEAGLPRPPKAYAGPEPSYNGD